MSLRQKFSWFAVVMGAGFLLLIVLVFLVMVDANRLNDQIEYHSVPLLTKTHELRFHVVQVQQWLTDISATRGQDGLNDGFEVAAEHATLVRGILDELSELDSDNRNSYGQIRQQFESYYQAGQKMAQAYIAQGPAGGNSMMASFDAEASRITTQVEQLLQSSNSLTGSQLKELESVLGGINWIMIIGAVILLGVFGYLLNIVLDLLGGIGKVAAEIGSVAEGNLSSHPICVGRRHQHDELGQLCQDLTAMKSRLGQLLQGMISGTIQLVDASANLSTLSGSFMNTISEQRNETDMVATAVTELTASSSEVAQQASQAAESASLADAQAASGRKVVSDTLKVIERMSNTISSTAELIQQVNRDSENIGTILETIRAIADQTNLLALNAAIEAARAGEQGRGFAVVADEVRTLASRTQEATGEIQQMIEKLQNGTESAVEAMTSSRQLTDQSVEQANRAGESLEQITEAVNAITDMSTHIAAAAREQSSVAEDVSRSVNAISDKNSHNADSSSRVTEMAEQLQQMAARLQQNSAHFQFDK
ncbi:methyl-accepting chemotaxis protein [Ectothiorhodospiraceae bacterium BW-2]|nr:methyl-accepting chemotaxis protein [Ectothiorhodospiraceae bacterium BW-2]